MTKDDTSQSLLDELILIGWLQRRLRLPYVWWGIIAFISYYIFPLIWCAVEGVLISPPTNAPPKNIRLDAFTGTFGRQSGAVPYLKDLTHLLMAVLVSIGGTLCIIALAKLIQVYDTVGAPDLIQASRETIALERARMEKLVRNRVVLLPFAVIAGSSGFALYWNGCWIQDWWGNPKYGHAGILLGIAVAVVIFYGMHSLYMLSIAQYSIGRLVSSGVHLRPFHADGCNGFGKLGNLLLLLLLLCVFCATAVWITIWHGYLGIEGFPGIWLAALGIVIFVPFIVIYPLVHVSTEIRRAQLLRLSPVERLLNHQLKGTEDHFFDPGGSGAKLEEMKSLQEFHQLAKEIYETSVFPFNRKVASVLSIGYIVQAVALAKEIAEKLK